MATSAEDAFRRLTIADPAFLAAIAEPAGDRACVTHLDARTETLLALGALVALDAPPSSFRAAVDAARLAGASMDDLLAVLAAVAGVVGSARVVAAAPRIALAAGYDVEEALEAYAPEPHEAPARS